MPKRIAPRTHGAAHHGDDANAFLPDPRDGRTRVRARDVLAETLAEEFVSSATSAEGAGEERDNVLLEEIGGPFVEVDGHEEFAAAFDESNPRTTTRAAFPTALRIR